MMFGVARPAHSLCAVVLLQTQQAEQRQSDRQNFLIATLGKALAHTAAEAVNSVEGLIEFFQKNASAIDGECQFSILPSSLTLFPVKVQHMHAVIVSPGTPLNPCSRSLLALQAQTASLTAVLRC